MTTIRPDSDLSRTDKPLPQSHLSRQATGLYSQDQKSASMILRIFLADVGAIQIEEKHFMMCRLRLDNGGFFGITVSRSRIERSLARQSYHTWSMSILMQREPREEYFVSFIRSSCIRERKLPLYISYWNANLINLVKSLVTGCQVCSLWVTIEIVCPMVKFWIICTIAPVVDFTNMRLLVSVAHAKKTSYIDYTEPLQSVLVLFHPDC